MAMREGGAAGAGRVRAFPRRGSVYLDTRGEDRIMRITWHPEAELVVASLWRGRDCIGSFRLSVDDLTALIDQLRGIHAEASAGEDQPPEDTQLPA
ncbi:MAG: hypothetical protein ACRCYQ_17190 [Nocardioides sp.]